LDGMILAAGLGTRLRPLTDRLPKALVEVDGVPLLDRTVRRLVDAGCGRIIVNAHHHAGMIERHLDDVCTRGSTSQDPSGRSWDWYGAEVMLSLEEDELLDTGGGIQRASRAFREGHATIVHNVDVISTVDLCSLVEARDGTGALATLAVQRRPASRYLVFDESGLCGRIDERTGEEQWARPPAGPSWKAGFAGIHALSPELPGLLTERGVFPIMDAYLRLAAAGQRILPFDVTGAAWIDVGTSERLASASRRLRSKLGP